MSAPEDSTAPAVWTLDKGRERVIAREREFKGTRFFDLRLWVNEGETPTSKGVTIPCEAVGELAMALASYAKRQQGQT